ncbi:hypothetical protein QSH57_004950 [Fusarium oxysporum f. sp. vasinfectum]|nr:hypothetical protein QSH57_004950 [Fusarium oxysporum f. sp. vasinfectum]
MASISWASSLRASIISFCQELEHIKDPDAVFREQLADFEDRSRRRLENLVRDGTFGCVPSLQQELLADNRQMIELELAHVASRAQRLEQYGETMEELARRMLRAQLNILGLEAIQKLVPELSAAMNLDEGDSILLRPNDEQPSASEYQPNNVAAGDAHVQAPNHEEKWDDESCQTVRPEANTSVTWCTLRRGGRADPHGNSNREQPYRAMTRRAPPRQNSPSPLATEVQVLHEHDDSEKALIRKRGNTLCNKTMNMGVDGHTTCILVFKNPVHDEWVSAGHIPEGQTIPSLDAIVAEHMGRRQEAGTDSPSIKVENSSPSTAMGRERDYMNMIMKELEMEHEVTRTKKQELQDEVAKSVGRRIVADVIDILGLSAEQHLMPAVPPPSEEATSTTKDHVDSASLPVPDDSDAPAATMGLTTRTRSYNRRKNGGARQKVAPSIGPSVSEGDSSLKRKHQPDKDDERNIKQEKKTPRVSTRQTPSSPGNANFDSVRSLPAPCTRSGDLLQHSNEKDVISSRKAIESQYKNIRLDVSRPSARVMLRRHPSRRGLWTCLIFVPQVQADMSFDTMVNRFIMPAFVQLANRRRTGNIREGQAALENAQPPVNTRSSLNSTGEGEGEMEKEQFESTGEQ